MENRRRNNRRLPLAHCPKNNLSSIEKPNFVLGLETPQLEPPSPGFRVPSPTESDEEELRVYEEGLADNSDHLSRLGESSSLFSFSASTGRSPQPVAATTPPPFNFVGSTPSPTNILTLTSSPPEPHTSLEAPTSHWWRSSATSRKDAQNQQRTMVVEREPPKAPISPQKTNHPLFGSLNQPEFGKASQLQNRLQSNNVFNIPKSHHARPEHHRPAPPPVPSFSHSESGQGSANIFRNPFQLQQPVNSKPNNAPKTVADVVEIPRPVNHPTWTTQRLPAPVFSSFGTSAGGFSAVNAYQSNGNHVDLTETQSNLNSDNPLFDDKFGATDPYTYVDAGEATENIKALLEGAFEDDDEKPRTRGRKKKAEAVVAGLADKLQSLEVKSEDKEEDRDEVDEEEEEDEDDGTVEGLNVKLLPHQVDGVEWMRDKEIGTKKKNGILPKGGILADDMGLGKTIQSLALILTNPRPTTSSTVIKDKKSLSKNVEKSTLVVAPLALIKQWEAEINNRVMDSHKLRVCVHHGPQRTKRYEDLRKYDVVITTYQILVSEHGSSSDREDGPQFGCFGLQWYRVILDEAHTIKNRNAKATQACCALRTEYRWCLTGTPMQNNLDELQSLIKFLRIKPYNELSIWKDQITRPMSAGRGGVAIKRLQFYLKAFMKRRTKDVLKQEGALNPGGKASAKGTLSNGFKITERRIESVEVEFSPEERRSYDRLEQRTDKSLEQMMGGEKMNYASALVLLLRLRQACNHPQLVGGNMAKDEDALTTDQSNASPRKPKVVDDELDDMANLLGGLSVETKKCDVCQIELSKEVIASGSIRCTECDEDLAAQKGKGKKREKSKRKKHYSSTKVKSESHKPRVPRYRRVIPDDSDEEDEGDWLVPQNQQHAPKLGKAGGSDDENAEGGGESIASEDSDTGDENEIKVSRLQNRKVINLDNSDEEADSASETEESSESSEEESTDGEDQRASITTSAKIQHLLRILHLESGNHKFIVFSQFTSMLNLIEPFLRRDHLIFTRYDGSMRNDHREASLERLRNDAKCRVLLCSLKCGSLGLNLTAASRVVILEPFWNPFVEEQAIDRVHRLTQTLDVIVYKLTIAHTVEARILALQEKKRALANAAIEGKAVSKLSMQDILNLFKREAEHDIRHDDDLGRKIGVLSAEAGAWHDQMGVVKERRRATPPVMERAKAGPAEDSVYGRRW